MKGYNYYSAVADDVKNWIVDNYTATEVAAWDIDEAAERLNDDLWIEDSVTGNGSGSYTFSRAAARDYVLADPDTVADALRDFCVDADTLAEKFLSQDWEYFDVTARCYVLGAAITDALDYLRGLIEEADSAAFDGWAVA